MNYYPFHVADYTMATRHLNFMQDLAYRRMIDLYMRDEKGLPNDAKEIAVLILMPRHWKEVQYIVDRYFFLENSLLRNNRCDIEIQKYQSKATRAKSANTQRWASKISSETLLKSDVILEPISDQKSETNQTPNKNQNQNQNNIKTDVLIVGDKSPTPSKRATQLADDWQPTEKHRELARRENKDCDREAEQFRDHHKARGNTFKDWNLAFNTWLRNNYGSSRATKPTDHRAEKRAREFPELIEVPDL